MNTKVPKENANFSDLDTCILRCLKVDKELPHAIITCTFQSSLFTHNVSYSWRRSCDRNVVCG